MIDLNAGQHLGRQVAGLVLGHFPRQPAPADDGAHPRERRMPSAAPGAVNFLTITSC
jgi:hypothetical protein